MHEAAQLRLIRLLDEIRDSYGDDDDPAAMFTVISQLLVAEFKADAGGIMLLSEVDEGVECVASANMSDDEVITLGQAALKLDAWSIIDTNTLGAAIILKQERLGSIVLIRAQKPFSDAEIDLLSVAESQIDSAVIQARTIWKYRQRNTELQAIYDVDHLRDYTHHETDLISGFTSVLIKYFQAELCMIMLSHADSGELIVRGVVDKNSLPAAALEAISSAVNNLEAVATMPAPADFGDLHLLAGPLIVQHLRLGGIIVGRADGFRASEKRLLQAMINQMDSAIAYSRVHQKLAQRTKELEVIYRIDQIRDKEADFDSLLNAVLSELCAAISGEMGYIMLYTGVEEQQLELISSTIEGQLTAADYYEIIQRFSRRALEQGHLIYDNGLDSPVVRSIVAVPLILNEKVIGVFGAINSTHARGFSSEDRRLLSAITSQVDTAIFERLEQRRMRGLLSRSVDPKVLDYLLDNADAAHLLAGERVTLSVLFADLRGSTEWTERTPPEKLVHTLNLFLSRMTDVIFKHGGTLDKFVGDEVIGLFGSPLFLDDHAHRAAAAALEMQTVHATLVDELAAQGYELPPMGVGVSSGEVITGEFGPPIRTDFTAMGSAVNLGARLCSAAGPNQVYISEATYDLIKDKSQIQALQPLNLKGISQPANAYELLDYA